MTLYGGMDTDKRENIKAAFQAQSPVRILLATDSASEGIDLQNHCNRLIHYEIPWNPNRLEQRNGRIDRHGQKKSEVYVYHFVSAGFEKSQYQLIETYDDLDADLEFLYRVVGKVEQIRVDLGKVGPVIAEQVEQVMLGARERNLDTTDAEAAAKRVRSLIQFERDINKQLEKIKSQLNETRSELRLEPDHIESVVRIGMELADHPPLQPAELSGVWPDPSNKRKKCPVFHIPDLRGTWAVCVEGLEHPYNRKRRPIVFDPSLAEGRDDVVLCHLNHRLVQMCLRLLRAEVWSLHDKKLNRVTARLVPNSVLQTPAVVGHARLVFLGADSQRLHEEIITAGGVIREGRFSRMNVSETQKVLSAGMDEMAPESVRNDLIRLWPTLSESLIAALRSRMNDRAGSLEKTLQERAQKEMADIESVLMELKASIEKKIKEDSHSLELFLPNFDDDEREQYHRDMEHLQQRLKQIPSEIEQEKKIVQERFANPKPWMFPVAVTFLVPEKIAKESR